MHVATASRGPCAALHRLVDPLCGLCGRSTVTGPNIARREWCFCCPIREAYMLLKKGRSEAIQKTGSGGLALAQEERSRATCCGWLLKRGKRATSKHRERWFVLLDACLWYFDDEVTADALGVLLLQKASFALSSETLLHATVRAPFAVTANKTGLTVHRDRVYDIEFRATRDSHLWSSSLRERMRWLERAPVVVKTGWLEKRGQLNKGWARRFFVAFGPVAVYLKDDRATDSQGFLLMRSIARVEILRSDDALYDAKRPHAFVVDVPGRKFICSAPERAAMIDWVSLGTRCVWMGVVCVSV